SRRANQRLFDSQPPFAILLAIGLTTWRLPFYLSRFSSRGALCCADDDDSQHFSCHDSDARLGSQGLCASYLLRSDLELEPKASPSQGSNILVSSTPWARAERRMSEAIGNRRGQHEV